jgi:two-component system cell cycle response regulator
LSVSARQQLDVLLVEDNPGDARLVAEMLVGESAAPYRLSHVTTVRAAIERLGADQTPVDVILLDLSLPDETGLETVRRVVAASGTASVVVMTGANDEELGMSALTAGAQDYLVKGQVDSRLLRRALRYAVGRHRLRRELESLSLKDDLTGLSNRRGFLALAEQQIKFARRNKQSFLILFLDLDQLKYINDTFGHGEGNRALAEAADVLRGCFRQSDILARLGGDEFAAFALNTAETNETAMRSRLEAALADVNDEPDRMYPLDFSVGILTCAPQDARGVEALLERADQLMYQEKRRKSENGVRS